MYVIARRPLSFVIGDTESIVTENGTPKLFDSPEDALDYFEAMAEPGTKLAELDCYIREAKPDELP